MNHKITTFVITIIILLTPYSVFAIHSYEYYQLSPEMQRLIDDAEDEAYSRGYDDAKDEAYSKGYDDGFAKGSEEHVTYAFQNKNSSDKIYDDGYEDGYSKGYEEGYNDGKKGQNKADSIDREKALSSEINLDEEERKRREERTKYLTGDSSTLSNEENIIIDDDFVRKNSNNSSKRVGQICGESTKKYDALYELGFNTASEEYIKNHPFFKFVFNDDRALFVPERQLMNDETEIKESAYPRAKDVLTNPSYYETYSFVQSFLYAYTSTEIPSGEEATSSNFYKWGYDYFNSCVSEYKGNFPVEAFFTTFPLYALIIILFFIVAIVVILIIFIKKWRNTKVKSNNIPDLIKTEHNKNSDGFKEKIKSINNHKILYVVLNVFLCLLIIFAANAIIVILKGLGIALGGIPTIIIYAAMFAAIVYIWKKYRNHKSSESNSEESKSDDD